MNVLVVGSGGREHALCWGIANSPTVARVCCAPGNAGIADVAECVAVDAADVDGIVAHVRERGYDLVVIGPEAPLVAGLADRLVAEGIATFGPSSAAARLEGSKVFAKEFMTRHGIPTAAYRVFDDEGALLDHLRSDSLDYPVVLKADGLAAGKGVLIVEDAEAAVRAADRLMGRREFGDAGARVLVEECLVGREASFFVLSDGRRTVELATCQDYKRAEDGDRGLNTGGMGTYSPSVHIDDDTRRRIRRDIIAPTIEGIASEGAPYRGVLFVGIMLTDDGPKVLEYNCRFGDPETQVMIPRLRGDWADLLARCARGALGDGEVEWTEQAAVCVVMAAHGYPGPYDKGTPITGCASPTREDGCLVFHAGTTRDGRGRLVTSGGRVLGVTALGDDLAAARARAYAAAASISWEGARYRTDIASDAIGREPAASGRRRTR